ncbi:uncharacterized protein LOC131148366 [Malania oleifera]|uniref:uncharacterized protein LOC131148366 n=1 Tax=Malania oleifera TaxID=397392 RepID=UPI0025AE64B5|nr:uncharacterized protein LOC131148366 [Malania oleifera]
MSNITSPEVSSSNPTSPSISDLSFLYFLHFVDHPGTILVSTPLNGDNYPTWKRVMKMALNAKSKFCFTNGTLPKPTTSPVETQLWERCCDMILSWILNSIDKSIVYNLIYHECHHDVWLDLEDYFSQSNNPRIFKLKRDIATLTQGSMTISVYFTTLKGHWDELAMLASTPYQILAMDPLPPVTKVYSILHQEERQRLLHISNVPIEYATMAVPSNFSHHPDSKGQGRGHPKCDHYGHDGHWKAHCYRLHGYPNNKSQSRGTLDGKSGS